MTDQRDAYSDWPQVLKQIAELVGGELALRLAFDCGGLDSLYIPHRANATHPWAQSIGPEPFARLCKAFGGERVSLPRGAYVRLQKRCIIEMAQTGATTRAIALQCHVTERYVRRIMMGLSRGPDPRQLKLFGG